MIGKLKSIKIQKRWTTCTFGVEHTVRKTGQYWIDAQLFFNRGQEDFKFIDLNGGDKGEEKLVVEFLQEQGFELKKKRYLVSWEYWDLARYVEMEE